MMWAERIERRGADTLGRHGVELPKVRRKKPGPADDFARLDGFEHDRRATRNGGFQPDAAGAQKIEMVRRIAFMKEEFVRREMDVGSAPGDKFERSVIESGEKGMFLNEALDVFHGS